MTGTQLRRTRRDLGLTQAQFAKLASVAPNTVARWERGERRIPEATGRRLDFLLVDELLVQKLTEVERAVLERLYEWHGRIQQLLGLLVNERGVPSPSEQRRAARA